MYYDSILDFNDAGVWWTLRYDQSVRLKIMDIEGIYLSAIAFTRDIVMT
jgi:hypothetical protein